MSDFELYEHIAKRLAQRSPQVSEQGGIRSAAVALLLQQGKAGTELFFIERAHQPTDPWSGNISFPGGHYDPVDLTLRHTAERETLEEVGIELAPARYLGRLSDIIGANLPVRVSCFVYGLLEEVTPVLSDEVNDTFWFGLEDLWQPGRHISATVRFGEREINAPAIDFGLPDKQVLWGITYRLVTQFRELLESGSGLNLPDEVLL